MAEDKVLRCKDCGQQFHFTVGEQEFFAQKGFESDPVRCAPCRRNKKIQRTAMGSAHFRDPGSLGTDSFSSDPHAFRTSYIKGKYGY